MSERLQDKAEIKGRWTLDEGFSSLEKMISDGMPAEHWIAQCPVLMHPFADREVSDLRGISLGSRRIGAMDLSDSFLNHATFVASELRETGFQWSLLSDASFVGAHLQLVQMSPVFGERVDFSQAVLSQVFMMESKLVDSSFSRARLEAVDFSGADLSRASFGDAKASACRLDHGSMREADFSRARLTQCSLRRSTAVAARFAGAVLEDCDLSGVDFRFADFDNAQLIGGKFGMVESNGKFFPTRFDDTPQTRRMVALSNASGADGIAWTPVEAASYFSGSAKAGQACPRSGYWFTPAMSGSRRYFIAGVLMPVIEGSDYGTTIWQWSPDQSMPKL